jgi:hypothetical protein
MIDKAKFSLKDDKEALAEIEHYASKFEKAKRTRNILIIIGVVVVIIIGAVNHINANHDKVNVAQENARLELILDNVNIAIKEQRYEEAEILANQLVWKDESGKSNHKKERKVWDKERREMLKTIRKRNNTESTWDKIKNIFD